VKICRFCNHEQENGEYCEACGSPLSTDRVDFTDGMSDTTGGFGAFPDPTAQAFPDPTVQAFPDPTVQAFPDPTISPAGVSQESAPQIQEQTSPVQETEQPAPMQGAEQATQEKPAEKKPQEHVVETPVAAFGTKNKGSKKEHKPEEKQDPDAPRKIIYSAAASGETVYGKSKGGLVTSGTLVEPTQPGPGWWNGAPNASANTAVPKENSCAAPTGSDSAGTIPANSNPAPVYTAPPQGQAPANPQFQPYNGLYTHAIITLVLGLMGLLCCCGGTFFSLIFSVMAYLRLSALKKGTATGSPEDVARQAKTMLTVADVLLALGMVVMLIIFLIV